MNNNMDSCDKSMKGLAIGFASVLALGGAMLFSSGCSVGGPSAPWDDGHVTISADARGMRAFGDTLNGMIAQGKASPDQKGAYFSHREGEEKEITRRAYRPGILEGLFSKKSDQGQGS